MKLPIGGGIIFRETGPVIYEPLSEGSFLVVEPAERRRYITSPLKEEKASDWSIVLKGGDSYAFDGEPSAPFWTAPTQQEAANWIERKTNPIDGRRLYAAVRGYFLKFGDFEDGFSPTLMALFVFESHVKPVLSSLFQLPIGGPFGAGKSAELSAVGDLCYHPFFEASASVAARARVIGQVAPTFCSDELDKTTEEGEDNTALVILRTGYRRGYTYLRWDAEKNTWLSIPLFFPLAYTMSTDVEEALKQRNLGEVSLSKSLDSRVPIINTVRPRYAKPLAKNLFFWRLEYLEAAALDGELTGVSESEESTGLDVDDLAELSPEQFRAKVYGELTAGFSRRDKFVLDRVFGREAELAYVALTVGRILGVDVVGDLVESLNRQLEAAAAEPDSRFVEFRRLIISYINSQSAKLGAGLKADSAGPAASYFESEALAVIDVRLSPVIEDVRVYAKNHKLKEAIGPQTLAKWYRKLGIVSGKNKVHDSDGDYLRVDRATWGKIRGSLATSHIELAGLPASDSSDASDAKTAIPKGSGGGVDAGKPIIESLESLESGSEVLP